MIYEILDERKDEANIPVYLQLTSTTARSYLSYEIVVDDVVISTGSNYFYGKNNPDKNKTFSYNFRDNTTYTIRFIHKDDSWSYYPPVTFTVILERTSSITIVGPITVWRFGYRRDTTNSDPTARIEYIGDDIPIDNEIWEPLDYTNESNVWLYNHISSFVKLCRIPHAHFQEVIDAGNYEEEFLDITDWTKLESGEDSGIKSATSGYDYFVRFGGEYIGIDYFKYMYKFQKGNYQYTYFCNCPLNEHWKAYPYYGEDGKEKNYLYLGMFKAFYNSILGTYQINGVSQKATVNRSIAQIEEACALSREAGNPYWPMSYTQYDYIRELLILFAKTDNLQSFYGTGVGNSKGVQQNNAVPTTGSLFIKNSTTNKPVYVLGMQDLWGNITQHMDGIGLIYNTIVGKPYPPFNITPIDYESTGVVISPTAVSGQYIMQGAISSKFNWWLPTVAKSTASSTTYYCDTISFAALTTQVQYSHLGGGITEATQKGPFRMAFHSVTPNTAQSSLSTRIAFTSDY